MKTYLNVPFEERLEAKALGAKWDAARKLWYVENANDVSKFMRWMPGVSKKQAQKWSRTIAAMDKRQAAKGRFR